MADCECWEYGNARGSNQSIRRYFWNCRSSGYLQIAEDMRSLANEMPVGRGLSEARPAITLLTNCEGGGRACLKRRFSANRVQRSKQERCSLGLGRVYAGVTQGWRSASTARRCRWKCSTPRRRCSASHCLLCHRPPSRETIRPRSRSGLCGCAAESG